MLMACVSVTGIVGSAHVCLVWRVSNVTAVPPTHGTSTVAKDVNLASATQNTRTVPPVTWYKRKRLHLSQVDRINHKSTESQVELSTCLSCQVSVPVSLVLEAGRVRSAENCSGAILRSNATVSLHCVIETGLSCGSCEWSRLLLQ